MSKIPTVTIKNLGPVIYHINGVNLLPNSELTQFPKEQWDKMAARGFLSSAIKNNRVLVIPTETNAEDMYTSTNSPVPAAAPKSQSRVGNDRVKMTLGVEGESTRDISMTESPKPDFGAVEEMTKAQIEDYADQFGVQLDMDDKKSDMISTFKSHFS